MRQAEPLAEDEAFAGGDHGGGEDHVVAELGGLPGARLAAMDDLAAHGLEDGLGAGEAGLRAAHHEGEGRALRAHHAAGDRRVEHLPSAAPGGDFAGGGHVDGGAVDEDGAGVAGRRHAAVAEPGRAHVLAGGEHGDDHLGAARGVRGRGGGGEAGGGGGGLDGGGHDVEDADLVARLCQVAGHRAAHVAEPHEADACHASVPSGHPCRASLARSDRARKRGAPTKPQRRGTKRRFDALIECRCSACLPLPPRRALSAGAVPPPCRLSSAARCWRSPAPLCVGVFFRNQIANGFTLLLGDRHDAVIALSIMEHWRNVLAGAAEWSRTAYFHPVPGTLGYNDGYLLFGLVYAAFREAGADPFLGGELTNMAMRAIGFLSMHAACRRVLGLSFGWSLLGAALFTLSNNLFIRASHAQLFSIGFLPALAVLLHGAGSALLGGRRGALLGWGAGFVLLFAALLMTGFYMAWYFAFLSGATFLAWLPIAGGAQRRALRRGFPRGAGAAGAAGGARARRQRAVPDAVPAQGGRDGHARLGDGVAARADAARRAACGRGELLVRLAGDLAQRRCSARIFPPGASG